MCREGTVEPLAVRARQSRCGTGAQGCQKPTATPGRAAAQGRRVDGRGQRGWALSSSLLVAGSDRLDRTPRGPLWGRGVWDYFCPLACGSQTRRRRWPCGQGMPSIRLPSEPVGLQGKWREGQERETKCTETPPGSWSCRGENHSVMFAILSAYPSASTAHTVLHQTTTRPVRSMVNFTSNTLAHLDYGQSSDI